MNVAGCRKAVIARWLDGRERCVFYARTAIDDCSLRDREGRSKGREIDEDEKRGVTRFGWMRPVAG